MTLNEVRQKYLDFFAKRGHAIIPSASLVPENDPTTLFTGSGMQPLLPYLLGQKHPAGVRLANSQKCFRAEDMDEVGDNRHTTFFEMLGNWSLGDYWKQEQLPWIFEFLTKEIGIPKEKLWVTCFGGDEKLGLPKDDESAKIWEKIGMPKEHIRFYDYKKNWWSRSGTPEKMPEGEPGGPDSEMFYEFTQIEHDKKFGEKCHPNCDCGRFMEIGNSVFMEYRKTSGGFEKLTQRNVDFGGGLERITAAASNDSDIFQLDVFKTAIKNLETYTDKKYEEKANKQSYRIVLDHIRAAVFLMADGVMPSNTEAGYFVRRLLRRAILYLDKLQMEGNQLHNPLDSIVELYKAKYPNLFHRKREIEDALNNEEQKFRKTLKAGLRELSKMGLRVGKLAKFDSSGKELESVGLSMTGKNFFILYSTYGFPLESSFEYLESLDAIHLKSWELSSVKVGITPQPKITEERKMQWRKEFWGEFKKHQEVSRAGADKKFKGGLADTSEISLKYHTATHLLHQALRDVLGNEVRQKGSNITPERLRFDFAFSRKMTDEEKKRVEKIVNEKIKAALPVQKVVLPFAEAEKTGALHFFGEKYGDQVNVYFIGNSLTDAYSKEFCGGPHVANTSELGNFKIAKEEAVSAGVRRIKAVLATN